MYIYIQVCVYNMCIYKHLGARRAALEGRVGERRRAGEVEEEVADALLRSLALQQQLARAQERGLD